MAPARAVQVGGNLNLPTIALSPALLLAAAVVRPL